MKKVTAIIGVVLSHLVIGYSFAVPDKIEFVRTAPIIDGVSSEQEWVNTKWHPLNIPLIGDLPQKADFSGAYRMLWDENYLYVNFQFVDDVLFDSHPDPLNLYWDDDCVEIFLDEDASGGDHLTSFNAFAYHVALDGNVVDIAPSVEPGTTHFVLLNEHITSRWTRHSSLPFTLNWELRIQVHNDQFSVTDPSVKSQVKLTDNKVLGFMMAYCDNDGSKERENFIGSHPIAAMNGDKNLGYKTADVFGKIKLVKINTNTP